MLLRDAISHLYNILVNRAENHGHPSINFERTATMWNAYLDMIKHRELGNDDIAKMMILFKISRSEKGYFEDDYMDMSGYGLCVIRMHEGDTVAPDEQRGIPEVPGSESKR